MGPSTHTHTKHNAETHKYVSPAHATRNIGSTDKSWLTETNKSTSDHMAKQGTARRSNRNGGTLGVHTPTKLQDIRKDMRREEFNKTRPKTGPARLAWETPRMERSAPNGAT